MAKKKGKAKGKIRPKAVPKPRQRSLPDMEQVRVEALEGLCEAIGDTRERANKLAEDEKGYEASAIQQLRKHGISTYRAHGVVLLLKPGQDRLGVKLVKEDKKEAAA